MKRIIHTCLLLAFAMSAQAVKIETNVIVEAQRAAADDDLLGYVSSGVQEALHRGEIIIGAAVAASPGNIDSIVRVAIRAGATAEQVATLCDTILTPREIIMLVAAAIEEDADPEPVIRRCLRVLNREEGSELIVAALKAGNEQSYESIIRSAYETLNIKSVSAYDDFVEDVLEADLRLTGEEAVSGFVEDQMAEHLLQTLLVDEGVDYTLPPEPDPELPSSPS